MLLRASWRRWQNDAPRLSIQNVDSTQLPFLHPVLFSQARHSRHASTASQPRAKTELNQTRVSGVKNDLPKPSVHRRNLASAAAVEHTAHQDYLLPWEQLPPVKYNTPSRSNEQSNAILPPFDPHTSPIFINDALSTHPKRFRNVDAMGGDINEIHQTLHACLQVGRLERAASLLRRLNQIYKSDAPGLLAAHNNYVKELSTRIIRTGDQRLLEDLQRWFRVELSGNGVRPDDVTYALMLQASLRTSDSTKDHTVRRYFALAEKAGLAEETMEILSKLERAEVSKTTSTPVPQSPGRPVQGLTEAAENEPGSIPEVLATPQKGLGLSTLKQALIMFNNPASSSPSRASGRGTWRSRERQKSLEENTIAVTMERWQAEDAQLKSIGVNAALSVNTIGAIMWQWHEKIVSLIKEHVRQSHETEQNGARGKLDEDRLRSAPYLQSLPPETISAVTILTSMKCCSTGGGDERGMRLQYVVLAIGDAVQNEFLTETVRNTKGHINWQEYTRIAKRSKHNDALAKLIPTTMSRVYDSMEWEKSTRIRIGAVLLSYLMDVAKVHVTREDPITKEIVQELQPVFFHTYQYVQGKRMGVLKLNPAILEKLARAPVASALAKYLPMVCEPKPWTGYREGGFLEHSIPVVRIEHSEVQARRYATVAAENGDMSQIFRGLNVLGKTPWRINRFVFDTMLKVWNSGEACAKIPPLDPPSEPNIALPESLDPRDRAILLRKRREFQDHWYGLKSQRCFQNFQMEVARAYLNETFYFPHNVDFRGRAYPMAPFLNHMGSDNCRGLLLFAKGKELTSEGLWWLKVHLANVYGYDKASFAERFQFTEDHLSQILDSVNDPLGGSRWWLDAEDPWQCLAACNELKNALDSPDPTRYVCQLPIHQDGTCNGLQHYAALGGDMEGAQQVNLEPGQRPSDVYTGVAEIVKNRISQAAAQGDKLATALDGKVTRKIVKQTVMTNVYGVTFIGAKMQVEKQLAEIYPDFPEDKFINRYNAARYIAKEIFTALASMFNGAHDIQYWLTDCAARISDSISPEQIAWIEADIKGVKAPSQYKLTHLKGGPKNDIAAFKTAVIWTTPLKMPVVQPYRKVAKRGINTRLQRIIIMDKSAANPIDKVKQVGGFPPNFIHSLDATHMFLTAIKCDELGLTFASIHDSFWTHAGDINLMNRVIRDAFILMHSEDIIGRLGAEFKARYKGYMHLAGVPATSPVGRKILAWRSKNKDGNIRSYSRTLNASKWNELMLENRRLRLLASDNPEEREEGEKMETPGRIFAEAADEKAFAPIDVKTAPLGKRSSRPVSSLERLKADHQLAVGNSTNENSFLTETGAEASAAGEFPEASTTAASANEDEDLELGASDQDIVEPEEKRAKKKTTTRKPAKVKFWTPLTFPPVPKKGDFDVTRLRNSAYFFS